MLHPSIRVGIVGATGYTGAELYRLLLNHPFVKIEVITSERNAGKPIREFCPWLNIDQILVRPEPKTFEADVVFLCQEIGWAMTNAPLLSNRMKVIDLSADFRLKDKAVYEKFYRREHSGFGAEAVYGLCEATPIDQIQHAAIVANPGCYPTASVLALKPIVDAGLVGGVPIIDAKSGVSGAGRAVRDSQYLFTELDGGFKAYGVVGHRHSPEIAQAVGVPVRFTPHLIPATRGIEATLHIPLSRPVTSEEIENLYNQTYLNRPFVNLVRTPPSTKQVQGSNRCDLYFEIDYENNFLVVSSVIDNLVKGAAGQAIQNMNLIFGLPEETGLPLNGIWP